MILSYNFLGYTVLTALALAVFVTTSLYNHFATDPSINLECKSNILYFADQNGVQSPVIDSTTQYSERC